MGVKLTMRWPFQWRDIAGAQVEDRSPGETLEQLETTRAILWRLFDNCPVGLFALHNTSGEFERVNEAFSRILGLPAEEYVGMPFEQVLAPEDLERVRDYRLRRIKGDPTLPTSYEMLLQNRFGDRKVVLFQAEVVPFKDVILGAIQDITREKLLLNPVMHAQKLESLATLAGGFASEFNNLLAAVSGYAQLAKSRAGELPEVVEALESIQSVVARGVENIQTLLTFARRGSQAIETVDLGALVHDLLPVMPQIGGRNITVAADEATRFGFTRGDGGQLEQALLTVLTNAVESLDESGGDIRISSDTVRFDSEEEDGLPPGDYLIVTVEDNGNGIPLEHQDRVFQPFFSTKDSAGHPGLGLAVAHGIVREHGGTTRLESERGKGTSVSFYLPRDPGPSLLVPAHVTDVSEPPRRTVLVVDDQDFVGELIGDVLETAGYDCAYLSSGREALRQLADRELSPDLAIIDLLMPDMDGRTLIRKIAALDASIPIVATSGFAAPEEGDRQLTTLTTAFLKKPFLNEELLALIGEIFGSQGPGEEE